MAHFRIRAAAKADLKGIAKFTEQTRGREQRNKYLAEFDQAFQQLSGNNKPGKSCGHIRTGYRSFPVDSHIIFYTIGDGHLVEIIRVLHKHMDVASRLFKA